MNPTADEYDANNPRLSPADARLLDALLNGETTDAAADPARSATLRGLLGVLDRWDPVDAGPGLAGRTLSAVLASDPVSLSAEDAAALDAVLALRAQGLSAGPMPAGSNQRSIQVKNVLSLLDRAANEPVPGGLVGRTLAGVDHDRAAQRRLTLQTPGGRWRPNGGSIRQIATTAALLLMVLSVLLPVLDKGRRDAQIAACSANLAGLGADLAAFGLDNKQRSPGEDAAAKTPGLFNHLSEFAKDNPDGTRVPPNKVALYVLMDERGLSQQDVTCPATKPGDAGSYYNGQNPIAGGPFRVYLSPRPVFADTNPLYRLTPRGLVRDTAIPGVTRSRNHDGTGQNVLISDGSVLWKIRPTVLRPSADNEDNIWLYQRPTGADDEGDGDVFLTP